MAGRGPAPKPAHLRQRTNRKPGATVLTVPERTTRREIPNPDGRDWHPLTLEWWTEACASPMAGEWLPTDWRGVGLIAVLYDNFYKKPENLETAKEIRLQSPGYGLNPLDRSRLQWEVNRADEAETALKKRKQPKDNPVVGDPRQLLRAVPK